MSKTTGQDGPAKGAETVTGRSELPMRTSTTDSENANVMPFPGVDGETASAAVSRELVVETGVSLQRLIADCDRLVVHGAADGELDTEGSLEVAKGGRFTGRASVAEAAVAGHFEGILRVSGCLLVRSGGEVSGDIRYGSLRVEAGGRISGQFSGGLPAAKVA